MSYGTTNTGKYDRVDDLKNKVDDVKGVMRTNINKISDNMDTLEEIHGRADELNQSATLFEKNAKKLKQKMWWQNFKLWILLFVIIGAIIAAIVVIIVIIVLVEK